MTFASSKSFNTETFKLTGKIVAKSKAAVLFAIFPTDLGVDNKEFNDMVTAKSADVEQAWFPNSQIKQVKEDFSLVDNKLDTLVVTQWIAKQKGYL